MLYTYRIVKENCVNGQRAKRTRTITRYKPLYSVKEASAILQISLNSTYQLMNQGKLPYLILGSKKIRGSDLEKFIENYPAEPAGA